MSRARHRLDELLSDPDFADASVARLDIERRIARLSPSARETFERIATPIFGEGYRQAEVAVRCGISERQVRRRLSELRVEWSIEQ